MYTGNNPKGDKPAGPCQVCHHSEAEIAIYSAPETPTDECLPEQGPVSVQRVFIQAFGAVLVSALTLRPLTAAACDAAQRVQDQGKEWALRS